MQVKISDVIAVGILGWLFGPAVLEKFPLEKDTPPVSVVTTLPTGSYQINVVALASQDQPDATKRKADLRLLAEWHLVGAQQIRTAKLAKFPQNSKNMADWLDQAQILALRSGVPGRPDPLSSKYPSLTAEVAKQLAIILRDPTDVQVPLRPTEITQRTMTDEQRDKTADLLQFIGQQCWEAAK